MISLKCSIRQLSVIKFLIIFIISIVSLTVRPDFSNFAIYWNVKIILE
jgi:hypothetical protein